ncbi:hypothetical protein ZIOFF_001639 [Zingiber officinale]|uniref:RNase H type-1 domain-containing protein n=1 Tax=Zingiber officinale TaxID=94328 RepID=A0A8J5LYM2_ZINOF|nr:hypothetical protein ZIOFF_001639 [Zingiber officinale]
MVADGIMPSAIDPSHFPPLSISRQFSAAVRANPENAMSKSLYEADKVPSRASYAAALRPLSPRASKKNFEGIGEDFKPAIIYNNKPGIFYTEEEVSSLAKPFEFSLIGKFSGSHPPYAVVLQAFRNLGLLSFFNIRFLRSGYVFMHLKSSEDMARVWIRGVWYIGGVPLRIFKWTPYFSYTAESTVVPVWIHFPDLPIHMFSKATLFSATGIIGKPIKIDEATTDCSRLSVARVCVEIDLLKPKIEDFWIGIGEEKRLQRVEFEKHPSYYVQCLHLGHSVEECHANLEEEKKGSADKVVEQAVADVDSGCRGGMGDLEGKQEFAEKNFEAKTLKAGIRKGKTVVGFLEKEAGQHVAKVNQGSTLVQNLEVSFLKETTGPKLAAQNQTSPMCLASIQEMDDNSIFRTEAYAAVGSGISDMAGGNLKDEVDRNDISKSFEEEDDSDYGEAVDLQRSSSFPLASNVKDPLWKTSTIICSPNFPISILVTVVYAKCDRVERRKLWDDVLAVKPEMDAFWLVGGDFNVISNVSEHSTGSLAKPGATNEFNNFIMLAGLLDAGYVGDKFTWTNGKVWKRLDKVLVSTYWGEQKHMVRVEHLSRAASDHCPMYISFPSFTMPRASFRFQKMWIKHHNFPLTVRLNWMLPCSGFGLQKFQFKLKRLKTHLKWWNVEVFGNIFENVKKVEEVFESAEKAFDCSLTLENKIYMVKCQASLFHILDMEEMFWKQKAAVKWFREGERNTKLFHNLVRKRRMTSRIFRIWDEEVCLEDNNLIQILGVRFFEELLTGEDFECDSVDMDAIPQLVSLEENQALSALPSIEELKRVVWEISEDSAAGLDGCSAAFYVACWDIIKEDLYQAIVEFFQGGSLPKGMAATTIVLIPKVDNAQCWQEFRPISLCWNVDKLQSCVPEQIVDEIKEVALPGGISREVENVDEAIQNGVRDCIVWKPSLDGKFTMKSTWKGSWKDQQQAGVGQQQAVWRAVWTAGIIKPGHWKGFIMVAQNLGLLVKPRTVNTISVVTWKNPKVGWFKLNMDGCSKGNPGLSYFGIIIRGYSGDVMMVKYGLIGRGSNVRAELMAILKVLELCVEKQFFPIWLESDSLIALKIISASYFSWEWRNLIRKIKCIICMYQVWFSHVYKEANVAADQIANQAFISLVDDGLNAPPNQYTERICYNHEIDKGLLGICNLNKSGLPYIRLSSKPGESEAEGGSEAEGSSEAEGGSEVEGGTKARGGSETEVNSKVGSDSKAEAGSEVGGNSEVGDGSKAEDSSEAKGGSKAEAGSEAEDDSKVEAGSEVRGESEAKAGSKAGGDSEVEGNNRGLEVSYSLGGPKAARRKRRGLNTKTAEID